MKSENQFLRTQLNECLDAIHNAVLLLEDGASDSVSSALEVLCKINDRGTNID